MSYNLQITMFVLLELSPSILSLAVCFLNYAHRELLPPMAKMRRLGGKTVLWHVPFGNGFKIIAVDGLAMWAWTSLPLLTTRRWRSPSEYRLPHSRTPLYERIHFAKSTNASLAMKKGTSSTLKYPPCAKTALQHLPPDQPAWDTPRRPRSQPFLGSQRSTGSVEGLACRPCLWLLRSKETRRLVYHRLRNVTKLIHRQGCRAHCCVSRHRCLRDHMTIDSSS